MKNLTALKVKIGIRNNGQADHPNFNTLPVVMNAGIDWATYVDKEGSGWLYDGCCGHKKDTLDSPFGQQWGMLLVNKQFADEAIARFPDKVSKLTALETETFYEAHHSNEMDEDEIDVDKLNSIKAKEDAGVILSAADLDARDPLTDSRGIRKNKNKKFVDYKADRGFNIV